MSAPPWICCHLGAREHYVVPRALHRHGLLRLLITDAWVRPGSVWRRVPIEPARRLAERFHPQLADAPVRHFTPSLLAHEGWWRWRRPDGWDQLVARNHWFGQRAAAALQRFRDGNRSVTVFAHSYSARAVFTVAKARGWTTVLGQIDPGEDHVRLVRRLAGEQPEYGPAPAMPPASYFSRWRDECALADRIIVNSEWSRESLERAGIPAAKLRVVPLAFEPDAGRNAPAREYPPRFTAARPMRLLFVGQASVSKGVPALLEAVESITDLPVALRLVGAVAMSVPERFREHPRIDWVGAVSRSDVMRHYRDSDVLVFPSHSDGFGMAQIEAQAFGLPVIASRNCGRVIENGVNGVLLDEVSAPTIAAVIRALAAEPERLAALSRNAAATPVDLSAVSDALQLVGARQP